MRASHNCRKPCVFIFHASVSTLLWLRYFIERIIAPNRQWLQILTVPSLWLRKFLRFLTGCWNQLGADRQCEGDHYGDSLPMLTGHETVISAYHRIVSGVTSSEPGSVNTFVFKSKVFLSGWSQDRRWFPINGTSYGCIPMRS